MKQVAFDEGSLSVPPEYIKVLEKGAAYVKFMESPAYRHLLDFLEERANLALASLRGASLSSDDRLKANLLARYEWAEGVLKEVQIEVQNSIAQREQLVKELGHHMAELDMIDFS